MRRHIGVAISGGGHRATMWGLGALLYLVDSGRNAEVATISSVSGGSITNGVVAHETDFGTVTPAEFDARVAPMVQHVAHTGLFFWGPATNAYILGVFAVAGAGIAALVTGLVLLGVQGLRLASGLTLLGAIALLAGAARWFEQRSVVVDRAMARTHFATDGRPTKLAAVGRSVDHVMCATELQSGRHLYFAPGFLYSYRFGLGAPGELPLSTAVQASACLPGAFSVRRLPAATYFPQAGRDVDMALTDGGVYDNMADEWVVGLAKRLEREPALPVANREVDEVLVVNASAPTGWTRMAKSKLVLLSEFATMQRVNSVMYAVTTQRRRAALFDAWHIAEETGKGMRGTFVHIAQSPYVVADAAIASANPEWRARAAAVLDLLGDDAESRARWDAQGGRTRGVATVLRKLGRDTTLDLMEHAYVLAMCNAHITLGYPLHELPGRERFTRLLGEGAATASVPRPRAIDLRDRQPVEEPKLTP